VTRPAGPGPCRRCDADDRGQTSLLIVGFTFVAVMVVALVVDASAAYLQRQGLHSVADGAALAAADGVQGEQVYTEGLGERALVDPAAAAPNVAAYLAAVRAAERYPGLQYGVTVEGDSVVVRVRAPLDLPLTPPGWTSRATISATSAALVVVQDQAE
jgi:hypothetical protein